MNIDLGSFDWDISKIEKQLIENRQQMEAFSASLALNKKALNEEKKEIQDLGIKIAAMQAVQREANKMLRDGTISQEEYAKTIADSNQAISEMKQKSIAVATSQAAHIKTVMENERAIKDLRLENNELNKLMSAGRTEIVGNEGAYRELNKELNALKTEANNLGGEMIKLKRAGKENTDEYRELKAAWQEASAKADALNDDFKMLDKAVGDNQRSVGDYKDQIVGAWGEIKDQVKAGDLKGAFDSFKEGFSGILNLVKTNPWILVLTGIAAFVKEMWEYNAQTKELNQTVEQIANTSGTATDELRKSAAALSETYGGEFSDRVAEINSLMTDFGLTAQQAFDTYNAGLAAGGALNSEFADSIREYGPLFAQNGYSAQEFLNILNAGVDLDIYSDKLPDAIKEAGLSLKENTKATRDALVNAFGATFADDVLTKVSSGAMTVKQALDEIAAKAKTAHLNEQQLAQLTADVFKGAGEDAGGALKIFEAINHAQEINKDNLTDLEKATLDLANRNLELADAKDYAFKSDSVIGFQQTVDNVIKSIEIEWYRYLGNIAANTVKEIDFIKTYFLSLRDAIKVIPLAFSAVMKGIISDFAQLGNIAKSVGAVVAAAFTFDANNINSAVDGLINKVKNFQSQAVASIKNVAAMGASIVATNRDKVSSDRAASNKRAQDTEKAKKILDPQAKNTKVTGASGDAAAKAASDAKKSSDSKVREAERAAKEQERIRKEQQQKAEQAARDELKRLQDNAQIKVDAAKNELANYIETNAKKLESDKWLNEQRWKEQLDYYEKVWALKQEELRQEEAKALLGVTNEKQRLNIQQDFATKRLANDNEYQEKSAEITKMFRDKQKEDEKLSDAIGFQQKILDMEAQHATEFEIKRTQLENDNAEQLAANEEQYASDKISYKNYLAQKQLIESQHKANSEALTKAETDAKMSAYGDMFGNISDLLGKDTAAGKAAALAQVAISQGLAIARIWEQKSLLPSPLGTIQKVLETGVAVGNVVRAARQINSVKAARGMLITGPSHSDGGVPVNTPNGTIEAEGGEVIINKVSSALFRKELSDINAAGGGVRFARGGILPSRLSTVQSSIKMQPDYSEMAAVMAEAVAEGSARGTYQGSQSGINDLSTNNAIAEGANF